MGFWDLFRSKSESGVKNMLNGDTYRPSLGMSEAETRVNQRTSMKVSTVYSCVRKISQTIAQLPLVFYELDDESGNKIKARNHKLYRILHDVPNDDMTSFDLREAMVAHLLLWGNSYVQILRNKAGEIVGLYPLMPDRMVVDRGEDGQIIYKYTTSFGDKDHEEAYEILTQYEVLHVHGLGYDGIVGYSPIAMAKNTIGEAIACDKYSSKVFANDARPAGILEHPGTLKNPKKLRDSWNSQFKGSENSHKIAILEEGMKFSSISMTPADTQFIETRKFNKREIAQIFDIPPHMVGDLERSTFSNIEEQSQEFVSYTLQPWISRIEQAMTKALLTEEEQSKYLIKFNLNVLLRGKYESRIKGYSIGIQNGFYSPNDVRELEDMDKIPDSEGGNQYLVNGSMTPLRDAGAAYQKGGGDG